MYSIIRFKNFSRSENIKRYLGKDWRYIKYSKCDIPEDSIGYPYYPNKKYGEYNAAWVNPDNPRKIVDSFELIEPFSKRVIDQMKRLDPIVLDRLNICLDHFRNGEYVYTDDDKTQDNNKIYYGSDPIYNEWDTMTHYLIEFQNDNLEELPYSKYLSSKDRLTYAVQIPEYRNGRWMCKIRISSCEGHLYNLHKYSEDKFRDIFG